MRHVVWPLDGSAGPLTPTSRPAHGAVLAVQELALQQIGPGASWADITMQCRSLLAQHLLDMNFAKGSVDALLDMEVDKLFMPHGAAHFLAPQPKPACWGSHCSHDSLV